MNSQEIAGLILSGKDADGKQIILREWEPLAVALAKAVKADGWISVDDRLPEFGEYVLLWHVGQKTVDVRLLKDIGNGQVGWYPGGSFGWHSHWMPLPACPKGENDE